jgi:cell wall-associated NlpC family hydrolase
VSSHETGRHRAPKSPTPASSFSAAISRSAIPASKASAVILMSGAMVASLALPASAVTPLTTAANTQVAFAATATPAVPSAAQAPLAPQSFGAVGFVGVVKPKPKPRPKPAPVPVVAEPATTVSRSNTRAPISTPTVVGIAASLAGIYYIYGGTTTAGFDCSGYTQYVFAKAGITLPRTSEEQQAAATPVSNPQPGDLVFFGYPAGHVGIYAGNGMMWDSPHTGASVGLHSVWSTSATYGRF